ncbi:MAG: DUF5724 domain-containing protein, partial [Tumebacillaceae bacterium]
MITRESNNQEAKTKRIVERLTQIADSMEGRNRVIVDALIQLVQHRHYLDGSAMDTLCKALWTDNNSMSMKDVFAGDAFDVLVAIFGEGFAEKVRAVWGRRALYIYNTGYSRRSWRSKIEALYLRAGIERLIYLIFLAEEGLSPERYFDPSLPLDQQAFRTLYYQVAPELWALEIDQGNQAVKEKLREAIFGETTHDDHIRPVIKALLMSDDSEAHQWVGDLLLAAKLQEGLRQTITELMDHGSRAAFAYLLKLILDHDLQRFSSVVRALDTWTGLGIEAQKPSVVKKCLTTAYRCLTDASYIEECLASNDTILIYLGLWAIAVDDVNATVEPLKKLLALPEKYKRTTALYFVEQSSFPVFQHRMALPLLDDPELEVQCWALRNLFGRAIYNYREAYSRQFGTVSELDTLFDQLTSFLNGMPKKEVRFEETVFPWSFIRVTHNDIIQKMMVCAIGNLSDAKFDALMALSEKMEVDTRQQFVSTFLKATSSDKRRLAVLAFLGDKSSHVRSVAMQHAAHVEFNPEDYMAMEEMLRLKSGDLRKNVLKLLLRQTPDAFLQTVARLAGEKNENKQLAALDLIVVAEKNDKFHGISNQCREIAVQLASTSQKANELAQKLINREQPQYTLANGFGLYDPQKHVVLDLPHIAVDAVNGFAFPSLDEVRQLLVGIDQVVDTYREHEYEVEWWHGQREQHTIGGSYDLHSLVRNGQMK